MSKHPPLLDKAKDIWRYKFIEPVMTTVGLIQSRVLNHPHYSLVKPTTLESDEISPPVTASTAGTLLGPSQRVNQSAKDTMSVN